MQDLQQLKSSDVQKVRDEILAEQNGKCAICSIEITEKTGIALDHQHKFQKEELGEDGAGLVRGVLCRACNTMEGKIWNGMNRYIQPGNVQERIKFLQNLISYYENGTYDMIHPSEKPKEPNVSKRNYNKLKKIYSDDLKDGKKKRKFPEYPKSGKLTISIQALFEEYGISPYNDSDIKKAP